MQFLLALAGYSTEIGVGSVRVRVALEIGGGRGGSKCSSVECRVSSIESESE